MPVFKIHHITKYAYEHPVSESINEVKIFPYQCKEQEVLQHDLVISHQPDIHYFNDYWGNKTGTFTLIDPHTQLIIESKLIVRTTQTSQLSVNFHSTMEQLQSDVDYDLNLLELVKPDDIEKQEELQEIINAIYSDTKSVAQIVEHSSEYIYKYFKYSKGITTIETTVDDILEDKRGVCQDFAHVLLQLLRSMNIPSRYVSGYICPNKNGMRGEGATHAWVEAWIPMYGWAGIDPTNNVWTTNNHIKLAVGRNFRDCSPVKGTFKGPAKQDLFVFVSVGYEDGQIFEETTQVQMERSEKTPAQQEVDYLNATFAAQQQQ